MKTKLTSVIAIAIIGIIAGITACNNDTPAGEQPVVQPDTPRTLTFGTAENPCTVTIKSDDQFTAAEWKTLCDKVVAAVERGYNSAPDFAMGSIATYFTNNIVSVVLLKSASIDVEVKSAVPKTMYLKANVSTIGEISGDDMFSAISAVLAGNPFTPSDTAR